MVKARLFGRDQELAQWHQLADAVAGGNNAELTISGPSGIGKTSLLDALCADAAERGWKVMRASGDARRQLPGAMLWQWFAPLAQRLPAGSPPFDGQGEMLHRFITSTDVPAERDALSYSASWVLRSRSEARPIVAAVDDAQWLDELSLAALLDIGSLLIDVPVLLVRGVRTGPGAEHPEGLDTAGLLGVGEGAGMTQESLSGVPLHWRLEPLTSSAIETWIVERQADAARINAERVQAASGGVPFFVEELLERDLAAAQPGASGNEETVLRERLHRLSEEECAVLSAVVVLGKETTMARVKALAKPHTSRVPAILERLHGERFLASARPRPAIQHALVGEALLAELAEKVPALYRRAAAVLMAEDADPAIIAGYLLKTEPDGDEEGARVLLAAACQARRQGAFALAAQFSERALAESVLPEALRRDLFVEAAHAHAGIGQLDVAEQHGLNALDLTTGTAERVQLLLEGAVVLYDVNEVERASHYFGQALKEVEADPAADPDLRRRVIALASGAGFQQMQVAERYAEEIAAILAQDPSEDGPGDRLLLAQEALRLGITGENAALSGELGVRAYGNGKVLEENGPESNIINFVTGSLNAGERDAEALELLDAAIAQARADSSVMAHATLAYCRGAIHLNRGRLRLAQVDLEASLRAAESGWKTYVEVAAFLLASVYLARDDVASADALLPRIPLEQERVPLVQAMALQLHGTVKAGHGDHAAALEHFTAAMDLAVGLGPTLSPWTRSAIESAARLGQREYAAAVAEEAVERVRAFGAPRLTGVTLRVAALAQPPEAAVAMLHETIELLETHEGRYDHALALADLAELCLLGEDPAFLAARRQEGLAAARKSLVLSNRIGAAAVAHRMGVLLAGQEAQLPLVAENKADRLTAAEYRVCSLAAKGMTNRQIAAELFITIKAVEWHLSRAYPKLEISSRKQLASVMDARD
ncbi:LuxR family transcriptional regulator [Arthrobacter crystallopoietes BAB-32]|uniref:LuxR family transcriptional regulator n=1 Tax=Arthrobacter crystallopoietes BAB-32 TaxID=1246476 RepID=N1UQQ3_9MICC|nr:LuxR family transcriptional regulator [Arthrobacter crystallopoietes]EMY32721.1 LuxR family transcriptional regulator [Arthrobacter crystallopoietes BAB-32]